MDVPTPPAPPPTAPPTTIATAHWSAAQVAGIAGQRGWQLPVIGTGDVTPIGDGLDLWDMWPIADADGRTVIRDGRSWWFFLATPRFADPETRHDAARIRLTSHGADGWRDHGDTFPDGFTPGSREWSGSAVLAADGETLTMYFTASGRRDGGPWFEQRLFETVGRFTVQDGEPRTGGWSEPVESVAADDDYYAIANQSEPENDGIKGYRDPGYFRDPADGAEYLLFVGSAAWVDERHDGVVGVARRRGGRWALHPPLVEALGVNSELERPHIVVHAGRYYLFWSTQGRRFAPGLSAPTGLYAMVADRIDGPWRPVNGTGLVAGNPVAEPFQAYCWWVTGELEVISFVDQWALAGADPTRDLALRRAHFGGTAAPWFRLAIDGDEVRVVEGRHAAV